MPGFARPAMPSSLSVPVKPSGSSRSPTASPLTTSKRRFLRKTATKTKLWERTRWQFVQEESGPVKLAGTGDCRAVGGSINTALRGDRGVGGPINDVRLDDGLAALGLSMLLIRNMFVLQEVLSSLLYWEMVVLQVALLLLLQRETVLLQVALSTLLYREIVGRQETLSTLLYRKIVLLQVVLSMMLAQEIVVQQVALSTVFCQEIIVLQGSLRTPSASLYLMSLASPLMALGTSPTCSVRSPSLVATCTVPSKPPTSRRATTWTPTWTTRSIPKCSTSSVML